MDCGGVGLGVILSRIVNGFDRLRRYWFEFSLLLFGDGFAGASGTAPGGAAPAPGGAPLASFSRSRVACAATCAMFNVMSCFCPPRSIVTVTRSEVCIVLKTSWLC